MEVFRIRIESGGKIQIPPHVLEQLELEVGQDLELEIKKKSLRISLARAKRLDKARALVRKYVDSEISLADELIEDRRNEAQND